MNNRILEIETLLSALKTRIAELTKEKDRLVEEDARMEEAQAVYDSELDAVIAAFNLVTTDPEAGASAQKAIPFVSGMTTKAGLWYAIDGTARRADEDGNFE